MQATGQQNDCKNVFLRFKKKNEIKLNCKWQKKNIYVNADDYTPFSPTGKKVYTSLVNVKGWQLCQQYQQPFHYSEE